MYEENNWNLPSATEVNGTCRKKASYTDSRHIEIIVNTYIHRYLNRIVFQVLVLPMWRSRLIGLLTAFCVFLTGCLLGDLQKYYTILYSSILIVTMIHGIYQRKTHGMDILAAWRGKKWRILQPSRGTWLLQMAVSHVSHVSSKDRSQPARGEAAKLNRCSHRSWTSEMHRSC